GGLRPGTPGGPPCGHPARRLSAGLSWKRRKLGAVPEPLAVQPRVDDSLASLWGGRGPITEERAVYNTRRTMIALPGERFGIEQRRRNHVRGLLPEPVRSVRAELIDHELHQGGRVEVGDH